MATLLFSVTVLEMVGAGTHEIGVLSFGAPDLDSAHLEGAKAAKDHGLRLNRNTRYTVTRFCDVCGASGIKPGCKRKACVKCDGKGKAVDEAIADYWARKAAAWDALNLPGNPSYIRPF